MAEVDSAQIERNSQIVWLTLLISQLVYVAVILSGAVQVREEATALPVLPIALGCVAVATGIGAHLFWRRASGVGLPVHSVQPDPARSFTFYMLSWMLDESIAVYGLVVGLLAFSPAAWAPFSVAAGLLMLVHRPSWRVPGRPAA